MVTVHRSICQQQMKRGMAAIAIGTLALVLPQPVAAATFHCTAGNVPCLIAAINSANVNGENNTIRLDAGSYTVMAVDNTTGGPNGLPSITGTITIRAVGADQTQIARASNAPQFRFFYVAGTGNLTLDRLTLTNGVNVTSSGGDSGAGVFNNGGVVNIVRSTFAANHSEGAGAIHNNGGVVNIAESRFTGNSGVHVAGVLLVAGGIARIRNSTFDHTDTDGNTIRVGGFQVGTEGTLIVENSSFTENRAGFGGGAAGIANDGGVVVVINTTFTGNTARGGATAIANFGNLLLVNSTLAQNGARVGNSFGPALSAGASATTLVQNTIIAENTSLQPTGAIPLDCAGPVSSLGNNLIGDVTGCGIILQPSDVTGDPGLEPFTDNGKPGNGHFPLLATSQAINAGKRCRMSCHRSDRATANGKMRSRSDHFPQERQSTKP